MAYVVNPFIKALQVLSLSKIPMRLLLGLWLGFVAVCVQAAISPAGAIIKREGNASFFNVKTGEALTSSSNIAWVRIASIRALQLQKTEYQRVASGQQVFFIYRLTQLSNLADRFSINVAGTDEQPLENLTVFEYQGRLPAPGTAPITRTRDLQPSETIDLLIMATVPASAKEGSRFKLTLSVASLTDPSIEKKDNNTVLVSRYAVRLNNRVNQNIVISGQRQNYTVRFSNIGEERLPERVTVVDDNLVRGLLLENPLPQWSRLDPDVVPVAALAQATLVVLPRSGGKNWISYARWNKTDDLASIGLVIPSANFVPGQTGSLSFSTRLQENVPANTRIKSEAKMLVGALPPSSEAGSQAPAGNGDVVIAFSNFLDSLVVESQGVVFNSLTRMPLAGARVDFSDSNGNPARHGLTGKALLSQITASDGRFGFPPLKPGAYFIRVKPPANFTFPSRVEAAKLPGFKVTEASYGQYSNTAGGHSGTAEASASGVSGAFSVSEGGAVMVFDVPVDPDDNDLAFVAPREPANKSSLKRLKPDSARGLTVVGRLIRRFPRDFSKTPDIKTEFRKVGYYDPGKNPEKTQHDVYLQLSGQYFNTSKDKVDTVDVPVVSSKTGDSVKVRLAETGVNTAVFRSQAPLRLVENDIKRSTDQSLCRENNPPSYTSPGVNCVLRSAVNDLLTATVDDPANTTASAAVSPQGVVFNSLTRMPLAGAWVDFSDSNGNPARHGLTGKALLSQITASDGRFGFPPLKPGSYFVRVTPPANFTFPSRVEAAKLPGLKVTEASYGQHSDTAGGHSGTAEVSASVVSGAFSINDGEALMAFDVPVDPDEMYSNGLTVEKEAKQEQVSPGELVSYQVTVKNNSIVDLYNLRVIDSLPFGFKYMKGSARINGQPVADPEGGVGPKLTFIRQDSPALGADKEMTISYALKAGAGAIDSDGINRVRARAKKAITGGDVVSNEAQAQVSVVLDGVLSSKAVLFGKVYVDTDGNGIQTPGEWPIGGVRLYMEDGTWAITDENGQYSLAGLRPGTHVIKVDPLTLPEGLQLRPLDNRNGADGNSRFAELSAGDMHRADFAGNFPGGVKPNLLNELKARNRQLSGDWLLDTAANYNRPQAVARADASGDLSRGVVVSAPEQKSQKNDDVRGVENTEEHALKSPVKAMPRAADVVKSITRQQGIKGAWLWPEQSLADGRFMAVVRAGITPTLYVNGQAVGRDRLGEQLVNSQEQAQVLAWYGVALEEGENTVEVRVKDMFGNDRVLVKDTFSQPGAAVKMVISPETETLAADGGRSLLPVRIRLLDRHGLPARGVYFVTLESTRGRWQPADIQDLEPGHQVRIDQGELKVSLRSGSNPGPVTLRASAGDLKAESRITQVAPARPLVAAGLLELNAGSGRINGTVPSLDEIKEGRHDSRRAAIFTKGEVAGLQLTLAFDSDKNRNTPLFRDENPDEYFPIVGDASQKGYEAQSRSPLYARIEKDRSSLMWGDFQSDTGASGNDLAKIQRKLTGLNGIYDNGSTQVQGFAASQEDMNYSEVIEANGTAMNYRLSKQNIVRNSEILVLETLSDNGSTIKVKNLARGEDYILDSRTGYLSFTRPLKRRDEDNNIQQVRASYDLQADGQSYVIAGVRLEQKLNDIISVGASYTYNSHETEGGVIRGTWVDVRPSEKTSVVVSGARMNANGQAGEGETVGDAVRVKVRHQWNDKAESQASWFRADENYKNAAGGISANRETVKLDHRQQVARSTDVRVEAETSKTLDQDDRIESLGAFVDQRLEGGWKLSGGNRYRRQRNAGQTDSYVTGQAGVEKSFKLFGRLASLKAEHEQAFTGSRWRTTLKGDWQVYDKVALYGQFQRDNNLSSSSFSANGNSFSLGLKSDWLPRTKSYSEYRMRGATAGQAMEWVNGTQTRLELVPGLAITPSVEWIRTIRGQGNNDGLALSMGLQDKRYKTQRANARLEYRRGRQQNYYGLDAAIARRFTLDWSTLLRESFRLEKPRDAAQADTLKHELTLGLARRPKRDNREHGLYMYQWKEERGKNLADNRTVHLFSTRQNLQVSRNLIFSGRVGAKWIRTSLDGYFYDSQAGITDMRLIWDINRRWDLDVRAGLLLVDNINSRRWSAGLGLYYLVYRNLRLGLYYNIAGFADKDLDTEAYNARGIHLSIQFKFDESIFDWFES